jgi:maltose O-acetyltransferase
MYLGPNVILCTGMHELTPDGRREEQRVGGSYAKPIVVVRIAGLDLERRSCLVLELEMGILVAARAVVSRDLPEGVLVGGALARVLRTLDNGREGSDQSWETDFEEQYDTDENEMSDYGNCKVR